MIEEETYVREFAFRPYTGTREGRLYRIWSIATFNFKHKWKNSWGIKVIIGFIIFSFVIQNMFLLGMKEILLVGTTPTEMVKEYSWYFSRSLFQFANTIEAEESSMSIGGMSLFVLIAIIIMGQGLISDDRQFKATEVYYSKINKIEYIIGKFGAFYIFGTLCFTLPAILEWVLLVVGIGNVDIIEVLPTLIGLIIFTQTCTLVFGSLILAFSSLTDRRIYAGLSMFIMVFLLSILVPSFTWQALEFTPFMYLDIFTVLIVFSYMLAGFKEIAYITSNDFITEQNIIFDLTGLAGQLTYVFIIGFILLGLSIVAIQVFWRNAD